MQQPGVNTPGLRQEAAERHVCGSAPAPRAPARPLVRLCGATWCRQELEDGGFRSLPGGRGRDESAAAHPPLGEATARAQGRGARGFGTRTGSGLLAAEGRDWGGSGVRAVRRSRR